jgi:hypothetical protein
VGRTGRSRSCSREACDNLIARAANNGLVLRAKSGGYTSTFTGAVLVEEQ